MPEDLVVARLAQKPANVTRVVVVVHGKPSSSSRRPVADGAHTALGLVQSFVLVGCDAVRRLDVRAVPCS